MKTLFLIRHAKSSWKDLSGGDKQRPLNDRGIKDAPRMGEFLKNSGFIPDFMITSTANRAYTTSKYIADATGYDKDKIQQEEKIYHAGPSEIMGLIKELDDKHDTVFLFGHNPTMTSLANHFNPNGHISNMPTCGVVKVVFSIDKWSEADGDTGKAKDFFYPKML